MSRVGAFIGGWCLGGLILLTAVAADGGIPSEPQNCCCYCSLCGGGNPDPDVGGCFCEGVGFINCDSDVCADLCDRLHNCNSGTLIACGGCPLPDTGSDFCADSPCCLLGSPSPPCVGDCDGDGSVLINELMVCVHIAMGTCPSVNDTCPLPGCCERVGINFCKACDGNGNGGVEITDLITAVNNSFLDFCGPVS